MQFGDTGWSERQVIADGEFVVHHGKRGGTWQGGSLFGFDVRSGSYSREVVFIYRLQNGRITDRWAVRDDLTMLRQLGGLKTTPGSAQRDAFRQPFFRFMQR